MEENNRKRPANHPPEIQVLVARGWEDYELLDSGGGQKLERFGAYTLVRPEHQAIWAKSLPPERWRQAHAVLKPSGDESGGQWENYQPIKTPWKMRYKDLRFICFTASSRHVGVFPEQSSHWDWMRSRITRQRPSTTEPIRVLNLFGYTGLATLAVSLADAQVTHVDASKKSILLARENQSLSGLNDRPIRWLVDDAFKFVRREVRRGSKYDAIVLDPPKFGRGPQGQVWELFDSLPELLQNCRYLLSDRPLFIILTAYAIRASALAFYYALSDMTAGLGGSVECGELALEERSAGRLLSTAMYARWEAGV
ncbi:MAG: class I SAM-dependent methyltransferase [Anaerolineales bacterium]|nr:class I SAM-dependent methyltransferase [Anaerolineales bacterium]